jgi:hypothetical protein
MGAPFLRVDRWRSSLEWSAEVEIYTLLCKDLGRLLGHGTSGASEDKMLTVIRGQNGSDSIS